MGNKYRQPATVTASIGQDRKDWLIARAEQISEITEVNSNLSAVVSESIDCYQIVLELFGEEWKDELKAQPEPIWAKKLDEIFLFFKRGDFQVVQDQSEPIEDGNTKMDVGGMLE